jgi:hypothetical protein
LSGFQGIKGTIRLARDPKSEWGDKQNIENKANRKVLT